MKVKVKFKCKDCNRNIRKSAVSDLIVDLRLCPQCYTKRIISTNKHMAENITN